METRGGGTMMKKRFFLILCLVTALCAVSAQSFAITAGQLHQVLSQGEKVTVIDIRNKWAYTESHIPNAINIPARLIDVKRLPPVGRVVVCGDGIDTALTANAVQSLNAKPGIQATMLEGGFGAWDALNFTTTRKAGFGREKLKYLSYQDLEKGAAVNPDIVLVDLRNPDEREGNGEPLPSASISSAPLTDLSQKFPGRNKIKLNRRLNSENKKGGFSISPITGRKDGHHKKLYVLIDSGDGESEKVARRLRAAGIKRVAILTGGERILNRDGQSGLKVIEK
jgi:rhodanese-related sulfurtransferase